MVKNQRFLKTQKARGLPLRLSPLPMTELNLLVCQQSDRPSPIQKTLFTQRNG